MAQNILYLMGRIVVQLYASQMLELDILQHETLTSEPKIFISNHPSATDPFLIHLVSPRPMSVLITAKAFSVPLFGRYLRKIGQISVVPKRSDAALEEARHMLQRGNSVVIFPEGQFSPREGGFHPPHSGAARLALSIGVPVVPVGIYLRRELSHRIASKISGKRTIGYWYLRGPYGITVGKSMRLQGDVNDRSQVKSITLDLMRHISMLAHESEQRVRKLSLQPQISI